MSMSAAVSPKSLIEVIGPAPSGRSLICESRCPISCRIPAWCSEYCPPTEQGRRHVVLGSGFKPVHLRVSSRCLLDLSGDQLLYLVGRNPWPWTDRQPHAHWDVGVFAFGHVQYAKTPQARVASSADPGNLTVLGEESRGMFACCLGFRVSIENLHALPIFNQVRAGGDDPISGGQAASHGDLASG